MGKKPGLQVNIGGETIIYIIILVVIFVFVLMMPNIYKFISDLKKGNLFKGNDTPVVENNNQNNEGDDIGEIVAETTLVCTLTNSTPEGNLIDTYTFYYNTGRLEKIKNEKNYDAIADEYLNYVYAEQARFNNMNNLYSTLDGFDYTSNFEARNLIATFVYDLTKLNPSDLNNTDEDLKIELKASLNQSLEQTKTTYNDLGYNCR